MSTSGLNLRGSLLLSTAVCCHLCLTPRLHAESSFEGEGRVVAVDAAQGTMTIDHGPIPGLMPAMRMAFPVQEPQQIRGLQAGTVVRFFLRARGSGWVVADLQPIGNEPPRRFATFQAPDFSLPDLSGVPIRLSDLRGKVVVVNFWLMRCGPCRAEMPTLDALYRRYKDRGLEVLAVNLDTDTASAVQAFVHDTGVTFRVALDPSSSTAQIYPVLILPTTYLVDRAGNVVVQEVGGRNWTDPVSQLAVEGLLQ
jgi:peroxiredoxin/Cu/Ag efflux protein CusF